MSVGDPATKRQLPFGYGVVRRHVKRCTFNEMAVQIQSSSVLAGCDIEQDTLFAFVQFDTTDDNEQQLVRCGPPS